MIGTHSLSPNNAIDAVTFPKSLEVLSMTFEELQEDTKPLGLSVKQENEIHVNNKPESLCYTSCQD